MKLQKGMKRFAIWLFLLLFANINDILKLFV